MDLENIGEDQGVRSNNGNTGNYYTDAHYNKHDQLINGGACARELQERRDVTHVMINDVTITKGEPQHGSSMGHGTHKPHHIPTDHQHEADLGRYGDPVKQRFTDGHISVISH
jgi:hypothetical protein